MNLPIVPVNEKQRLTALYSYQILNTQMELEYDMITKLAAKICGTQFSFINFIDHDKQWTKSSFGLDLPPIPRHASICPHAILSKSLMVVSDLTADARFKDLSVVTDAPSIRFYAGMPLVSSDGFVLGTLCVVGLEPRTLNFEQEQALVALATKVMSLLERRKEKKKFDSWSSRRV